MPACAIIELAPGYVGSLAAGNRQALTTDVVWEALALYFFQCG